MPLERDPALVSGDPFLHYKNVRQFDIAIDGQPFDIYEFHLEEDLFSSLTQKTNGSSRSRTSPETDDEAQTLVFQEY